MRRALLAVVLTLSIPFSACKEDADQSPAGASPPGAVKCKSGIDRAVKASTVQEADSIYYSECSALFAQPVCRAAWSAAAKLPPGQQIPPIADACRKAYCPSLTAFAFEACRDDFKATPESLQRAWPPLFDAILAREAAAAAPEVSSGMLVLYAHLQQLAAAATPPSASAAAEGSAGPPSASGTTSAPAASGSSAIPAASASGHAPAKASPTKAKP
ncbi:MAG TPA: hypothetical protein VHU80_17625 [Polyangiaceae bacterium]|jgi:hypothetical protein|nr:hypothetical protein [Polyangiaceae bacterium]